MREALAKQAEQFIKKLHTEKFKQTSLFKFHREDFNKLLTLISNQVKNPEPVELWSFAEVGAFSAKWFNNIKDAGCQGDAIIELEKQLDTENNMMLFSTNIAESMKKASTLLLQYRSIAEEHITDALKEVTCKYLLALMIKSSYIGEKSLAEVTHALWKEIVQNIHKPLKNSIAPAIIDTPTLKIETDEKVVIAEKPEKDNLDDYIHILAGDLSTTHLSDMEERTIASKAFDIAGQEIVMDLVQEQSECINKQRSLMLDEVYKENEEKFKELIEQQNAQFSAQLAELQQTLEIERENFKETLEKENAKKLSQENNKLTKLIKSKTKTAQLELDKIKREATLELNNQLKQLQSQHDKAVTDIKKEHEQRKTEVKNANDLALQKVKKKI